MILSTICKKKLKKMRIIDNFNSIFCKKIKKGTIIFGQNITTGSRISGLTNNIEKIKKVEVINTQNSEASLTGFGFGLMIANTNSIYFSKQLDFIILGLDHIINTLNSMTLQKISKSFSIITYIVDSGFEGPQSRFHCLSDISSMSKANCNYLIFPSDIKYNLRKLNQKSFNIFCLSQKHSKSEINPKPIFIEKNGDYFQYNKGNKNTLITMGFAAYEVFNLVQNFKKFKNSDFFAITNPSFKNIEKILRSVKKTKKVYLFDDGRSKNKSLSELEIKIRNINNKISIKKFYRNDTKKELYPNADNYLKKFEIT